MSDKKKSEKLGVEELEKRQAPFIPGYAPESPRPRVEGESWDTVQPDADMGEPGSRGSGRPEQPRPR